MKKNYIILIIITAVLALASCKKEEAILPDKPDKTTAPKPLDNLYKQLPTPNFGNIKLVNGDILRFESPEHYEQVYKALEAQCEAWMDLFLKTYDTGSEDHLDSIVEQLNFDENLPLKKFEEKYKKTNGTLLSEIALKEETWLARGGEGSPPSDEITDCPIELALLSQYHEYCIGDTICQLRPEGYQILIHSSNLKYLNQIRNSTTQTLLGLGRGIVPPSSPPPTFPVKIEVVDPPLTILDLNEIDCSVSEFSNSGWIENDYCSGYKFHWTYKYGYNWNEKKVKTNVTMTNWKWKSKKNKWVKDCGSFCKIEISTALNAYYYETKDCIGGTHAIAGAGFNTKVVWKSFTIKQFAQIFEVTPTYPYQEKAVGCKRHNTDDSYIYIRHKGVVFNISVKTKLYTII